MSELKPCAECGMHVKTGEYHPYAACLMFKACNNSETVRANIDAVMLYGSEYIDRPADSVDVPRELRPDTASPTTKVIYE